MKNNKGFSLVELIVVIAIMAILAAVAIPTFAHFINKANVASDKQFVADVEYALDLAYAQFDDDVTSISITNNDGTITTVQYVINNKTYSFTKGAVAVTGPNATELEKQYAAAGAEFIGMIDWDYNFKAQANLGQTITVPATEDAGEDQTPAGGETPADPENP